MSAIKPGKRSKPQPRTIRRWQPEDRIPWTAASIGTGLFGCGVALRGIGGDTTGIITTLADATEISAYLAIVVMVARLIRTRSHDRDPTNLLDAAIGVTGLPDLLVQSDPEVFFGPSVFLGT